MRSAYVRHYRCLLQSTLGRAAAISTREQLRLANYTYVSPMPSAGWHISLASQRLSEDGAWQQTSRDQAVQCHDRWAPPVWMHTIVYAFSHERRRCGWIKICTLMY